ncbi:MAG: glycosyltransferase family protein [Nakamurella sp.]
MERNDPVTRVLAASVYPMRAASTRLRIAPVLSALADSAISSRLCSFVGDEDLRSWLDGGIRRVGPSARGFARIGPALRLAADCDLLLLQREALPLNNLSIEKIVAHRRRPIVWDVDDAIWTRPIGHATVQGGHKKYAWLARNAQEIWAGSEYAATWAKSQGARNVQWVPSTVPVPAVPSSELDRQPDLLVWIGTPSTGPFVEALLHDLSDALAGWRVLVVGAAITVPAGVDVTQVPWSPAAEANALLRASVGLYPLDLTHPAVMGKSALKSVLFMANAIPVVATPTQSNRNVMTAGREGYFASNKAEWRAALGALRDPALRRSMGAAGHAHAAASFNTNVWAPQLARRLSNLLP